MYIKNIKKVVNISIKNVKHPPVFLIITEMDNVVKHHITGKVNPIDKMCDAIVRAIKDIIDQNDIKGKIDYTPIKKKIFDKVVKALKPLGDFN